MIKLKDIMEEINEEMKFCYAPPGRSDLKK